MPVSVRKAQIVRVTAAVGVSLLYVVLWVGWNAAASGRRAALDQREFAEDGAQRMSRARVRRPIMFQAVLDDVPPIRTPSGRRRIRPGKVHADKAYDSGANRAYLRRRGIRPRIARRGVESSVRLGATAGGSSGRCRG